MSAPRFFVDDRQSEKVPEDAIIREIAPDDFVARSSEQTFKAALKKLERQTSCRQSQYPRCPECASIQLQRKRAAVEMPQKTDTAYKCRQCGAHFDEPAPPRDAQAPGEQATLPGVRER